MNNRGIPFTHLSLLYSIHQDLDSIRRSKPCFADLIKSLQDSYKKRRQQFKNHLRRLKYSACTDGLVSERDLKDVFKLSDGRIIAESDKKLGFVILSEDTYRDAYLKINVKMT